MTHVKASTNRDKFLLNSWVNYLHYQDPLLHLKQQQRNTARNIMNAEVIGQMVGNIRTVENATQVTTEGDYLVVYADINNVTTKLINPTQDLIKALHDFNEDHKVVFTSYLESNFGLICKNIESSYYRVIGGHADSSVHELEASILKLIDYGFDVWSEFHFVEMNAA